MKAHWWGEKSSIYMTLHIKKSANGKYTRENKKVKEKYI